MLTKVKNLSKQIYFREKFQQSQSDIKQTWKTINQVIRKTTSPSPIPSFNYPGHNVHINDPNNLSDHFNDYFSSVGSNLATVFPPNPAKLSVPTRQNHVSMFISPI